MYFLFICLAVVFFCFFLLIMLYIYISLSLSVCGSVSKWAPPGGSVPFCTCHLGVSTIFSQTHIHITVIHDWFTPASFNWIGSILADHHYLETTPNQAESMSNSVKPDLNSFPLTINIFWWRFHDIPIKKDGYPSVNYHRRGKRHQLSSSATATICNYGFSRSTLPVYPTL